MDLYPVYRRTIERWNDVVDAVRDDQWDAPTPCSEWSVRDLVNHVTSEDLWTVPLVQGSTIEQVGSRFDGDVLGDAPTRASADAAQAATSAVETRLPQGGVVQLSFGDTDVSEYVWQLAADHLVHSWDLSCGLGTDRTLDPELVSAVAGWFADREELYRAGGAVGPRPVSTGGPQADLLAAFGRDAAWAPDPATTP
jgi:uncharacterized protein (TIGR03086 family)